MMKAVIRSVHVAAVAYLLTLIPPFTIADADEAFSFDLARFGYPVSDSIVPTNTWSHGDECSTLTFSGGLLSYAGTSCSSGNVIEGWSCDWKRAVRNYVATQDHPYGPVEIGRGSESHRLVFWLRACQDKRTSIASNWLYSITSFDVDDDETLDAIRSWFLKQGIYDIRNELAFPRSRLTENLPDKSLMQITCNIGGASFSEGLSLAHFAGTVQKTPDFRREALELDYDPGANAIPGLEKWRVSSTQVTGAIVTVANLSPPNAIVMLQMSDGSKKQLNRMCLLDYLTASTITDNINASLPWPADLKG